jgi:hypothetical protein
VRKEDPASANSRVTIQADAEGLANGCTDSILGPVAVLSPSSMCSLTTAVAEVAGDRLRDLGLFLQLQQQHQGCAVYSVDLPLFFSLDREDFALTDAFFGHYKELQRIATREVRRQSGYSCACRTLCIDRVQLLQVSTHANVDLAVSSCRACTAAFVISPSCWQLIDLVAAGMHSHL